MRNTPFDDYLRRSWTGIALLIAGAMALVAGPAGAATTTHGEAVGTGEEESIVLGEDYGTETQPFCFEVLESKYRVDVDGEFYAEEGDDQAGYAGPAELHWETTERYWIAPEGIYTNASKEDGCDPESLGEPVEANVWVERVGSDGFIEGCEANGEEAYSRLSNVIEVDWTGDCLVNSNLPTYDDRATTGDVGHLFEGTLDPGSGVVAGTWVYPTP